MTEMEALQEISYKRWDGNSGVSDGALSKAIDALEKQIPKKPLMSEMYTDYGYLTDMYNCPSCSNMLCFKGNFVHHDYCNDCGQRIDWSDEE